MCVIAFNNQAALWHICFLSVQSVHDGLSNFMGCVQNREHAARPKCSISEDVLHVLCCVDVQGCQDSKLQAERIAALHERKQALEALLSTRVGELKQVCLQEAVRSSTALHFLFQLIAKN